MNKRPFLTEFLLCTALIVLGVVVRVFIGPELPNFTAVAAISLFAGYFFSRAWLALLAPLVTMLISDAVIGGYKWQAMLTVYMMLSLPIAFGWLLRRLTKPDGSRPVSGLITRGLAFASCSLISSVLFFLVTNCAWLPWNEMYADDVPGLILSYQAGIPFFKYTVYGDLLFGAVLFGSYALAVAAGFEAAPGTKKSTVVLD